MVEIKAGRQARHITSTHITSASATIVVLLVAILESPGAGLQTFLHVGRGTNQGSHYVGYSDLDHRFSIPLTAPIYRAQG